jgi:hypothetical protein
MEKANKTLAAMIRAVDGPKKIPRVVIDVTGGIVQSIISDSPVDVVVYDTDDPPDGGLTVGRRLRGGRSFIRPIIAHGGPM